MCRTRTNQIAAAQTQDKHGLETQDNLSVHYNSIGVFLFFREFPIIQDLIQCVAQERTKLPQHKRKINIV